MHCLEPKIKFALCNIRQRFFLNFFGSHRSLTALGIRHSDVLDQGATYIANFLRGNASVTDLNIERSKIGSVLRLLLLFAWCLAGKNLLNYP